MMSVRSSRGKGNSVEFFATTVTWVVTRGVQIGELSIVGRL